MLSAFGIVASNVRDDAAERSSIQEAGAARRLASVDRINMR